MEGLRRLAEHGGRRLPAASHSALLLLPSATGHRPTLFLLRRTPHPHPRRAQPAEAEGHTPAPWPRYGHSPGKPVSTHDGTQAARCPGSGPYEQPREIRARSGPDRLGPGSVAMLGWRTAAPSTCLLMTAGLTGQRARGLERWDCPRARLSAPTSRALLVALRPTTPSTQGKRSPCSIAKVCFEDQEGDRKMSEAGSCL